MPLLGGWAAARCAGTGAAGGERSAAGPVEGSLLGCVMRPAAGGRGSCSCCVVGVALLLACWRGALCGGWCGAGGSPPAQTCHKARQEIPQGAQRAPRTAKVLYCSADLDARAFCAYLACQKAGVLVVVVSVAPPSAALVQPPPIGRCHRCAAGPGPQTAVKASGLPSALSLPPQPQ